MLFIVIGARVLISLTPFKHKVDNAGEFVGRGGNGFGGTELSTFAAIVGAEGAVAMTEGLGGDSEGGVGAIFGVLGASREAFTAGDGIVGAEAEPGGEMFDGGPKGHIEADFSEDGLGSEGIDPINLGQINAGQQVEVFT